MWLDNFNEMRKQSGLNLDELSLKANIPKGTLAKISAGITKTPTLETMRSLVHAMGYTLNDLEDENYLQQKKNYLSNKEDIIIKKYRALDEHGKKMIDVVLAEETARMEKESATTRFPATTPPPPEAIDIEAEVEEYRHQLELQAKAAEKSSALRNIK